MGLYEFLAVDVMARAEIARSTDRSECPTSSVSGTSTTSRPPEICDDEQELGPMALTWAESTIDTRTQNETYDDDPGIGGLRDLTNLGTDLTATPNETFDDNPGVDVLGTPLAMETTVFTKVVGETHDDDGVSLQLDV